MGYRITVKISTPQGDRYVELDRAQLSYSKLRNEVERRTKQQGQWFLKAGHLPLSNDQELLAAVTAAEGTKKFD